MARYVHTYVGMYGTSMSLICSVSCLESAVTAFVPEAGRGREGQAFKLPGF